MKVKKILVMFFQNKFWEITTGIVVIAIFISAICVQTVWGQKPADNIFKSHQTQTEPSSSVESQIAAEAAETLPAETTAKVADISVVSTDTLQSSMPTTAVVTIAPTSLSAGETESPSVTEAATATTTIAATTIAAKTTTKATLAKKTAKTSAASAATQATTASVTAATTASCSCGTFDTAMANAVLDLVNQERAANNLPALSWNDSLAATAQVRAQEIVIKWAHTRPCGDDCFSAFPNQFCCEAENLGRQQTSAQAVFDEWMQSSAHASNILNDKLTQIGVACYISDGTYYWVQDFGG